METPGGVIDTRNIKIAHISRSYIPSDAHKVNKEMPPENGDSVNARASIETRSRTLMKGAPRSPHSPGLRMTHSDLSMYVKKYPDDHRQEHDLNFVI